MQTIKILIPTHVLPDTKTVTTIFFQNLLPILKKKFNVKLIWFIYTFNKIPVKVSEKSNEKILDIHNYKNAVEVITTEKPDLVYCSSDWSFIDYAFYSVAAKLDIPIFFIMHARDLESVQKKILQNVQSNFSRFLENSLPTDNTFNEKKFMKRGRFFLFKYLFLVKTKIALNDSILHTIFNIWKYVLTDTNNPRFASNTIQFLENNELEKYLIKSGFKKSNLIVTGNPMYDDIFKKLHNIQQSKNDQINILFAPSTLFEHGFWTLKQRDITVKEITQRINENDSFKLSVKIHPSTSVLSEYATIIHSINPTIPIFQKGSIEDYLQNVDVIISSQSSTAEVYGLLANKRIVICNFFDSDNEDIFVKKGLAVSCNHPSDIISSIENAKNLKFYEENRQKFIDEFLFKWDGKSSERICDYLIDVLQKN